MTHSSFIKLIKIFQLALVLVLITLHSPLLNAQQQSKTLRTQQENQQRFPLIEKQGIRRAYRNYKATDVINFSDVPIVYNNGVLFTLYAERSDTINVSGSFFTWQKKLPLRRGSYGVYFAFLEKNLPAGNYPYKFQVNGMWINHAAQQLTTFNDANHKVSYFTIAEPINSFTKTPVHIGEKVFRFYLENKNYAQVSWLGSINRLDPKESPMQLQGKYWVYERRIEPEQSFYAFYVDGELMLDPQNPYLSTTEYSMELNYIPSQFYASKE